MTRSTQYIYDGNRVIQERVSGTPTVAYTRGIDLSGSLSDATRRIVGEVERRKIEQALKEAGGDRGRAADILQIGFKTFLSKLKEHALEGA